MSNDPSSGDQPGWQGQQGGYPGYGQPRAEPPYGGSYPPPTQQGAYGQTPSWQQPAAQQPQVQAQGASAWPGGAAPGGYPAGMGPGGPSSTGPPSFFAALFDLGFNSFATPFVIKAFYVTGLVVIALSYALLLIFAFNASVAAGLLALVGGALFALFYLILFRITLEFYYATIRMAEDIRTMRDRQQ